jgi:hypothetical protein
MRLTGRKMAALAAGLVFSGTAAAANFTFSGNIANHNDVIYVPFSLSSDALDVKVWTDSFQSAVNFDPITAVWSESGPGWNLVGQNDDNASIAPGQTYYDSGLTFASLTAGSYLFTIATYANFAVGSTLAEGFGYAGQTPIPLATCCQPASHCGMGTFWQVNLSGVDDASVIPSPIPEPETYAMLLAGFGLLGWMARRRRQTEALAA